MDRNNLIETLDKLVVLYNQRTGPNEDLVLEMERVLEEYLKAQPNDEEMLVKLALVEYTSPPGDYEKAIHVLNKVLTLNPLNTKALLIYAEIESIYWGIQPKTLERLQVMMTEDKQEEALMWYEQALYYRMKEDSENMVKALERSLKAYSGFVFPLTCLARYYKLIGEYEGAQRLYKEALANVKTVGDGEPFIDILNSDRFIDQFIKGIYLSSGTYESIKKNATGPDDSFEACA